MLHTPGPWFVELDVHEDGSIDVMADDLMPVANVDVRDDPDDLHSPPREVALANAKLIAQAPRLGALLLSAYQHVSHGGPTREEVQALLRDAGLLP